MSRSVTPAVPLAEILEKDWQRDLVELAKQLGWHRPMHIYDARRSEPGWPDLALVRDRLLLLELKTETKPVSPTQKQWIRKLVAANVETYVVRPRHLQAISRVLQARGPRERWTADQHEARGVLLLELDPILQEAA